MSNLSICDIVTMNRSAVSLMSRGTNEDGYYTLTYALTLLREQLLLAATNCLTYEENEQRENHQADSTSLQMSIHSIPIPPLDTFSMASSDNIFTLFNKAFTLSINNSSRISDSENCNKIAAILLYNTGLIHHKRAFSKGDSIELLNALWFYNRSYTIAAARSDSLTTEDTHVMLLALWNNMGHIYSIIGLSSESLECIRRMQILMHSMERSELRKRDILSFFFKFVVVSGQMASNTAPAA